MGIGLKQTNRNSYEHGRKARGPKGALVLPGESIIEKNMLLFAWKAIGTCSSVCLPASSPSACDVIGSLATVPDS